MTMKYSLLAFHEWLGNHLGWWLAVPLISLFWIVLWPVGLVWAVVSLVAYYSSLDRSPKAVAKRRADKRATQAALSEPVPFYVYCWMFCWLPLVSQGLVPIVLTLAGNTAAQAFFIAFYLPEPLQWPFMIAMTVLGAVLLGIAIKGTNWRKVSEKIKK